MDQRSEEAGRTRDGGSLRASAVRTGVSAALIFGLYALLPVTSTSDATSVVVLVAGVILLGIIVAVRVQQIQQDPRPGLRAAEALALVVPLFVALFSWSYVLLSAADPGAFSEPLNRIDAAYFCLMILSTVGFGDISPTSDLSRLLVAGQIVISLTLLAGAVRAILLAARTAAAGRRTGLGQPPAG
jgi:voltage-gated potassium channel